MTEALPADPFRDLACAACQSSLSPTAAGGLCARCGRTFPLVGGIPCMMPDPEAWRVLWQSRVEDYAEVTRARIAEWSWEAEQGGLLAVTRERLIRVVRAKQRELETLPSLLSPLREGAAPTRAMIFARAQDEDATRLAVLECYENVFRDWAWGGSESERLVELLEPHVPKRVARLAILGVGAGRFAADAHCRFAPERTFALDLNPLPLLIAERLIRGERLDLNEFPASPLDAAQAVVSTELSCPERPGPGFQLVFADGLQPPFEPESLDAVLAPWFVDVCGADLRATLSIVNRTLRNDGVFVQLGPLRFNSLLSRAYSFEECRDLFEASGFEVLASSRTPLPYFDSPHGASRRIESVYLIVGRKRRAVPAVRVSSAAAPWIEDTTLPVPLSPELSALGQKSMLTGMIVGQVDGKRSIAELAGMLATSTGIDAAEIEQELKILFGKLPVT